jgi:hypothetical protein
LTLDILGFGFLHQLKIAKIKKNVEVAQLKSLSKFVANSIKVQKESVLGAIIHDFNRKQATILSAF